MRAEHRVQAEKVINKGDGQKLLAEIGNSKVIKMNIQFRVREVMGKKDQEVLARKRIQERVQNLGDQFMFRPTLSKRVVYNKNHDHKNKIRS